MVPTEKRDHEEKKPDRTYPEATQKGTREKENACSSTPISR
jgi:hypothetical protein